MNWKRTPEELALALNNQKSALLSSCQAYDAGQKWEALRLATATYVLVFDAGNAQRSLLTQLGTKGSLQFLSSGRVTANPNAIGRYNPLVLVQLRANGTADYVPILDFAGPYAPKRLPFDEWWEREVVFKDGPAALTRKQLVLSLRNQDGGSHLDDEVRNPSYVELSRRARTFVGTTAATTPVLQAELAMMRQIAWELLKTLGQ